MGGVLLLLGLLTLAGSGALQAAQSQTRPRIGVVLSGGSAKGFAHIGVLRVLEQRGIPVDVVTGTSMGSIVGGLYATGASVDSLEALALGQDWAALFGERIDRQWSSVDQRVLDERVLISLPFEGNRISLPSGAVEGASVLRLLEELTWPWSAVRDFGELPIPFAAVATDLETGEPVHLGGGVLASALRASMAIPGIIEPHAIDGRLLVDGGISRNLPAQDAERLGADFLICSDVTAPLSEARELENFFDILNQVVALGSRDSLREERDRCDVLVSPELDSISSLSFDDASTWMERGRAAAMTALDSLPGDLVPLGGAEPSLAVPAAAPIPSVTRVDRVQVVGLNDSRALSAVSGLLPMAGEGVSADTLTSAIGRVSAIGLFREIRYRIDATASDTILVVEASPRTGNRLGLGLRYDGETGAALLFTGSIANWLGFGSRTRLQVRLGNELQIEASWLGGPSATSVFSPGASLGWKRANFDVGDGGGTRARVETQLLEAGVFLGFSPGSNILTGVDVGIERVSGRTVVSPVDASERASFATAGAILLRETLNRTDFPQRGSRIFLRSEAMVEATSGDAVLHRHVMDVLGHVSLRPSLSLRFGLYLAASGGDELPLHRRIYAGGVHQATVFPETRPRLAGLDPQAQSGQAAQIVRAGVVWQFASDRFAMIEVDTGSLHEEWTVDLDAFTTGWAATIGAASIVGPVTLTAHGQSLDDLTISFAVGRVF